MTNPLQKYLNKACARRTFALVRFVWGGGEIRDVLFVINAGLKPEGIGSLSTSSEPPPRPDGELEVAVGDEVECP